MGSESSQQNKEAVQRSWEVEPLYQKALLVEYKATQDKIAHSDRITWQRGSILLAAVVASLAFVATNLLTIPFHLLIVIASWSTGIILMWYLWDRRLQTEVILKFRRLHEIERMLGFRQHLMIDEADKRDG